MLNSIGYEAFRECSSLEEIALPKNFAAFDQDAFGGCTNLKRVVFSENTQTVLPASPEIVANCMPFSGCPLLQEFVVPAENPWFEVVSGALVDKLNYRLILLPPKQRAVHFTVPESIEIIESYAFFDHRELSSILLPRSLKEIRTAAFVGASLREIDLPEPFSHIAYSVFAHCSLLESIRIPEGVQRLWPGVFRNCSNLSSVELPSTLTTIDHNAFVNCSSLRQLIIPEGVESIGGGAISDCENLEFISLPASLTNVKRPYFPGCPKVVLRVVKDSYAHRVFSAERFRIEVV